MMTEFFQRLLSMLVALFTKVNNATFLGIHYTNSYGEEAKHVVILDASYTNACDKAIEILKGLTDAMFSQIAELYRVGNVAGIQYSNNAKGKEYLETGKLPKEGTKAREQVLESIKVSKTLAQIRDEIIDTILKNRDSETRSAQSVAQNDAYMYLTHGIKYHVANETFHIFAKAHSKEIVVAGNYPEEGKKYPETLQKEAISKYCKYQLGKELPHELWRNFSVSEGQLKRVKVNGTELTF